jgi:hypothetical protein
VQFKQQRLSHSGYSTNGSIMRSRYGSVVASYLRYQSNSRRREIALNKRTNRHDMVAYRRWNG